MNNSIHDERNLSGTPGLRLLSVPRWSDLTETAHLSLTKRVAPASLMIPDRVCLRCVSQSDAGMWI